MSVCPSGTTRLPLDGFSLNLIFIFLKSVANIKGSLKSAKNNRYSTLHEDRYTLLIKSRSFLLRMKNVSGKSFRRNQNRHFKFYKFLLKTTRRLRDNVEKYRTVGQATNMTHAHCMLDSYVYKHTLRICNIYCFPTAKMIPRTSLNVTLDVHCISC